MGFFILLQTTFTPSVPFGKITGSIPVTTPEQGGQLLTKYISEIYNFGVGAGAFLAVVMIMWGGFLYITSSGISSQAEKGKEAIKMAFLGLVLLFTSYILLQTINPALITLKFPNVLLFTKNPNLPGVAALPAAFGEPDRGVALNHGACVVRLPSGTDVACVENTTQDACRVGFSGQGTWFPHLACSNQAVQNLGRQTTPVTRRGRCIVKVSETKMECYGDIPNSLCPITTTTTWQEGTCDQVPRFVGACWEPDLTTLVWICSNKTEVDCTKASLTTPIAQRAKFCGENTICTSSFARQPSCSP